MWPFDVLPSIRIRKLQRNYKEKLIREIKKYKGKLSNRKYKDIEWVGREWVGNAWIGIDREWIGIKLNYKGEITKKKLQREIKKIYMKN